MPILQVFTLYYVVFLAAGGTVEAAVLKLQLGNCAEIGIEVCMEVLGVSENHFLRNQSDVRL